MSDRITELETSMQLKLVSLGDYNPSNHTIHKVPDRIRKLKEECYSPLVVSIGPVYYGQQSVEDMEEMKWRHLQCFLRESSIGNIQHYITLIRDQEAEVRRCYAFQISLSSNEFIRMLLLDSAFIIYFFMSTTDDFRLDSRPMEYKQEIIPSIERDLFLEENQLPFFLLNRLYDSAFGTICTRFPFVYLVSGFISRSYIPGREGANRMCTDQATPAASEFKHLVDFLRFCCLPTHPQELQPDNNNPEFPLSATELKAAGVRFRASDSNKLLDIRFAKGVLEIPKFVIQDGTESIFRSIMFYEQCHHYSDSYFTDYMAFLDDLMNTPEDMRILVKSGIIKNWLGDDGPVVHLFNSITKQINVDISNFFYSGICRDLRRYANKPCNRWIAILRRNYFNHPWAAVSVAYAIVLLILTVLQVISGFKRQ